MTYSTMRGMANKPSKESLIDNMSMELRRGALTLAVLSCLQEPQYGYSLKQSLDEQGLGINEGTLYPLLRRLEKQGLLESKWEVIDEKRPRRYYQLSATGATILANLKNEWDLLVATMNSVLSGPEKSEEKWKQTS